MLAAILWLYAHTGSFDFVVIRDQIMSGAVPKFPAAAQWLFLGFFLAFAVKVPLFPFSYVVAGCSRGGADGGVSAAGGRAAQDGNLRVVALQPWTVSRAVAAATLRG